jgi:hypothetical protein
MKSKAKRYRQDSTSALCGAAIFALMGSPALSQRNPELTRSAQLRSKLT